MAAAYGFHLCQNDAFFDGNKRITLTSIDIFLQRNGHQLVASEEHAYEIIMKLSTEQLTKKELAEWIRKNSSTFTDS